MGIMSRGGICLPVTPANHKNGIAFAVQNVRLSTKSSHHSPAVKAESRSEQL